MGRGGKNRVKAQASSAPLSFLGCPSCKSIDSLYTIEKLEALSGIASISFDGELDYSGESEMLYDTSQTIGVLCRNCDWEYEGDNWMSKLVPASDSEQQIL